MRFPFQGVPVQSPTSSNKWPTCLMGLVLRVRKASSYFLDGGSIIGGREQRTKKQSRQLWRGERVRETEHGGMTTEDVAQDERLDVELDKWKSDIGRRTHDFLFYFEVAHRFDIVNHFSLII